MAYIDQSGIDDLKATLAAFDPQKNKRGISRARSSAVRATKTEAAKGAAKVMALRSSAAIPMVVRKSVTSKNKQGSGSVSINGRYIQGKEFENEIVGPKPPRGSAPVGVKFYKDGVIKKQDGYFRTRKKKGKKSPIMKRKGRSRLPLILLQGPTVFDIYGSGDKGKKRQGELLEFGAVKYQSELSRQIDVALREL